MCELHTKYRFCIKFINLCIDYHTWSISEYMTNLTELFENIKIDDVLCFWREIRLYEKI